MNTNLKVEKFNHLLELRAKLQQLTQLSFQYSQINKQYPLDNLTSDEADQLIKIYTKILEETQNLKPNAQPAN